MRETVLDLGSTSDRLIYIPELWRAFLRFTKYLGISSRMNAITLPRRVLFQFRLKTSFQRCRRTSTGLIICWPRSKILLRNVDSTSPVPQKCSVKLRKLHKVKPPDSIPAQSTASPKWLVLN